MKLENLIKSSSFKTKAPRKGRGNGSKGTYCGRGCKGQNSRTGGGVPIWFEGGQTPLFMRLPKLGGFRNINRKEYQVVNISDLEAKYKDGDNITVENLKEKGLINKIGLVKILGNGKLSKKLIVNVKTSTSAIKAIEKAGGSIKK